MKQRVMLFLLLPLLAACASGEVRDTLGLSKKAPDEFVVVSRPPLAVPPDFNLVPPEPGKQGPRHSAEAMAKSALLGEEKPASNGVFGVDGELGEFTLEGFSASSAPESAVIPVTSVDMGSAATSNFLSKTGAEKADPEIRTKLGKDERDPPEAKEEAGSLYEQIIGADREEPVVEPKGEAERLRKNKDAGKKANEGDVVTEDKKEKSVLDSIW